MIITDATSGCNDSGAVAPRGAPSGVRADSGPLGNIAKTYSPDGFDPETGEVTTPNPQLSRANRWALKSLVNKLLPDSRTSKCMVLRAPVEGQTLGDIQIVKGIHKKAFYQGLLVCGRVWTCPVCAAKIAERRRQDLRDAIKAAIAMGMRVYFVTLTVKHGVGDDLQELLDKQSQALKRLSQGKYSIKSQLRAIYAATGEECPEIHGYIRALEVTHGENGFHPHFHLLVFTSENMPASILQYVYSHAWKRACRLAGLPEPSDERGVTVKDGSHAAEYASKWGLEDEMTKAHVKTTKLKGLTPWGMLRAVLDGDDPDYPPARASALFRVYAKAFHGRRQLYWSNGLRKLLQLAQELTDEELIAQAEDEQSTLLATITVKQWRAIRQFQQEAHLLTVAEDAPALLATTIERLVFMAANRQGGGASGLARMTTPEGAGDSSIR